MMTPTSALEQNRSSIPLLPLRPSLYAPPRSLRNAKIRATALSIRDVSVRVPLSQSISINMDVPPLSLELGGRTDSDTGSASVSPQAM